MANGNIPLTRCGIDTVEIARVERLLLGPGYGAPRVVYSPRALELLTSASAVAMAEPA